MINRLLYKLKLKKPKDLPDRETLQKMMPLRNKLIEWQTDEKGEASLVIPLKKRWWIRLLSKIQDLPTNRVVVLDEVGTRVWELCDGNHSIRQMIRNLRDRYKMTRKEAETSLITYLQTLGKRGFIAFAVPKKGDRNSEKDGEN